MVLLLYHNHYLSFLFSFYQNILKQITYIHLILIGVGFGVGHGELGVWYGGGDVELDVGLGERELDPVSERLRPLEDENKWGVGEEVFVLYIGKEVICESCKAK